MPAVEVSEDELKEYYAAQKERFTVPEQRRARHILIEYGDDKTKAKEKAQAIYEKAKAGESFEKLAKENSDDVGSSSKGGDLGFFGKGIMDKNFEDAAFSMNVGDISKPVASKFGFHIIKLEEIKKSTGKLFDEVKKEIDTELRKQKAEKLYFEKAESLANLAYETPDSLEAVKDQLNLKIQSSPFISKRGGAGIFRNRKLLDIAFSNEVLKENLNSQVIEIDPTHSVVIRLNEYKPAQVKPLSEVKARVKNKLINNKALERAKTKAKDIEAKIKVNNSPAEFTKDKNYKWTDKKWIKRSNTDTSREIVQAAFAIPRKKDNSLQTKGIKLNNGDYAVVIISGVKDGDIAAITEEQKIKLSETIANASGIGAITFLIKSLKDNAEIETFPENL